MPQEVNMQRDIELRKNPNGLTEDERRIECGPITGLPTITRARPSAFGNAGLRWPC
jgi:hypothetical protein